MCDHEDREAAMVVIHEGISETPGDGAIWCDPCLVPLVTALNDGGLPTVASCCGHGHRPGSVILSDGSTLLVLDKAWGDLLSAFIHSQVGCQAGRGCSACEPSEGWLPEHAVDGREVTEGNAGSRCFVRDCPDPPVDVMVPLNPNMTFIPPYTAAGNPACRRHALSQVQPCCDPLADRCHGPPAPDLGARHPVAVPRPELEILMSKKSRLAAVEKAINAVDDAHEPTRYCREGVCQMCGVIKAVNAALRPGSSRGR